MSENRLLLMDTFFFLHRSFHAYPIDLKNSAGERTNILFGFAQSLLDSIMELSPTHIACGWESEDQPSFRKVLFPQYQITRVSLPDEEEEIFGDQLPKVIELIDAFNVPRLMVNWFEGDDVLGTAAALASKESEVVISSADQDLLQLVGRNILVYRPARPPYIKKQLFDEEEFVKKYGFNPVQMIDYKALRGDPSDNIPGVKGIGDKTAKSLIEKFGSLENIYSHVDEVGSSSVREKLEKDRENAFLSKQLATIITNIPMEFNLDACQVHDFEVEKVRELFKRFEFKSLMKRLDHLELIGRPRREEMKKSKENK